MVYAKYGNSLSNRKKLMQTFVLISVTVMLVISIVKSSLALSLGLVGALSIVRFRAAIKEPEELIGDHTPIEESIDESADDL